MSTEDLAINKLRREPPGPRQDFTDLSLKMRLNKIKNRAKDVYGSMHPNDGALNAVIDMCLVTRPKVLEEHKRFDKAIQKAIKDMPDDPKTKIRRDFLEYQKWFIEAHAQRAEKEAARRRRHLDKLDTIENQKRELATCARNMEYWFNNYAWIVDPRSSVLYAFPFELFKVQRDTIKWIDELIFVDRTNGLIDKSRDMGVTWLIITMFVYYWLFPKEGTQFHALITSYREDEVDKSGVPGTIFEKIRQQIRLLPSWMLPKGFKADEHMTHMKIVNPENGSSITGTTANAETGRSGRFSVIFFDEFASIKDDISSATAASQSSDTCIFVSTPKGKLNHFSELRFGGNIPVKSLSWKEHPFKDHRWYSGQKLKMSKEMIAQELDIDYDASQPGKVYQVNEVYHVITKSDFMREIAGSVTLDQINEGKRRFRIPKDWWLGRDHDWGSSDSNGEHANLTYWFARAKVGTRTQTHNIDISGAVFVYRELLMPPHSTVRQVANKVKSLQAPDNEQDRMQVELMSHEATSERDTYEQEHQLYYKIWDTDYNSGIAQVRDYLEIQYLHQPHPFRKVQKGKPLVKGRPMIYFIVDDDQGECYFDEYTNKWQVRPGKDERGLSRIRAEIGVYHYAASEAGKPVKKQRPVKQFDDAMDCLRCMAVTFPPVAQYTMEEQVEKSLPRSLRTEEALKATPEDRAMIWLTRQSYIAENKIRESLAGKDRKLSRRDRVLAKARQKMR